MSPWSASPLANILIGAIGVISSVCLARGLGAEGRGNFAAACIWPGVVLTVGGMINMQCVTYFWSKNKDTPFAAAVLGQTLLLAAALSAVLLPLSWVVNSLALTGHEAFTAANVYAWSIPLSLFAGCIFGFFLAEERFGVYWSIRISNALLYAAPILLMVLAGALTVPRAVYASLLALVLSTAASVVIFCAGQVLRPSWNSRLFAKMLLYGTRVNLAGFPYQLNLRLDQLLMSLWLSPALLGYYSSAFSWSSMLLLLGNGIAVVMLSRSSRTDPGDSAGIQALLSLFRLISCALALIGLVLAACTPLILPLLFGTAFWPAVAPAVLLCLAGIFLNMNVILHEMARGLGFPELGVKAESLGLILTLALLFVLLPRWQGIGAALASLASYGAVLFILAFQLSRRIQVPFTAFVLPTRNDLSKIPWPLIKAGLVLPSSANADRSSRRSG